MNSMDTMILAAMKQAEEAMTSHNRSHSEPGRPCLCGWDFGEDSGGSLDALRLAIERFKERAE